MLLKVSGEIHLFTKLFHLEPSTAATLTCSATAPPSAQSLERLNADITKNVFRQNFKSFFLFLFFKFRVYVSLLKSALVDNIF